MAIGAAADLLGEPSSQRKARVGAWLFMAPLLAWLICFVVIPTIMLVVISFCERGSLGRVVYEFTWSNYQSALGDPRWLKILWSSIWYAFLATVICMVVGYPVAYYIGRAPEKTRNLLLTLVMIPFWTSFLIRTYAWITILSENGLLNGMLMSIGIISQPISMMYTPFAVVLGLVYNYLPFMILPIYTSVEKLDNALIEAAYDLGATPLRAFSNVILPLTQPGIAAGALLVFVPAIAMFAITTLMGGGSNPTIGEAIQNQVLKATNLPMGAALGSLLLLIFIASLWLIKIRRQPA